MSYILCTDLDRTLIPNGHQPADSKALPILHALIKQVDLRIIYISGRDLGLVNQAISTYTLPVPDFVISDVGSQIYCRKNNLWEENSAWATYLQKNWESKHIALFKEEIKTLKELREQESSKQSRFKLSYYYSTHHNIEEIKKKITQLSNKFSLQINIITSIDETSRTGMIDILPGNASKLHAIDFLVEQNALVIDQLVFAGDSGNDMSVLTSNYNSILVKNAETSIKQEAYTQSIDKNVIDKLFIAQGGVFGLNGHYCSGIIEGLAHYYPELDVAINKLPINVALLR